MTGDAVRQRLAEISASAEKATKGPWHLITDSCDCSPAGCSHGENGTSEFAYAIHTPEHELWQLSNGEPDTCDPADPHDHFHHDRTEVSQFSIADCEFIIDARSSVPRLVAALTAVLDLGAGLSDEHGIVTTGDIRRAVAAALEEQP